MACESGIGKFLKAQGHLRSFGFFFMLKENKSLLPFLRKDPFDPG
jgi:hypothetical protein